ncbi:M23 family metallopeptidase [Mesobacillus harenae]|uniref:M23 family metallopeptidase n=1 Tax=Mesobacillus harenae TaxID=2213203 RepID=UPI001580D267|nr:M23 family metallopeptidase [Mesobacillus harenae]
MREEETKRSSQGSKFFKKRWVYPAIYIASAAIILTGVLWFQNGGDDAGNQLDYNATDVPGKKYNDQEAIEVNRAMENFVMPVMKPDEVVIQKEFYDNDSQAEKQEAALVFYNNQYHPNTGIDITTKDGEAFDILAALSGTVTDVKEDSLLGNVIEIEHDKGIVTQYSSVTDFKVKVGDQVDQGQAIAKAGKSMFNEEAGVHVHFEIRKDSVPVNPLEFFNKPLSALQEFKGEDNSEAADDSGKSEDGGSSEEEAGTEETTPGEETGTDSGTSGDTEEGDAADTEEGTDKKETDDKKDTESDSSAS